MSVGKAFRGLVAVLAVLGAFAPAARAALSDPSSTFTGANSSTAATMAAFDAAAGGADNGTTAGEQGGGFRHLTWDGIAVDGSDPGSTVITPGHVAAVARSRAQPWGIELGPAVAVANDGFASVNSHAGFAAFSAPNEWAPFNSSAAELEIVAPTGQTTTPVPALTRGLGVVFLNAGPSGTTIEYFNGQTSLGQVSALPGATSFAGLLFRDPVVTRVVIALGSAAMFTTDGSPVAQNPVAGDDLVLAEPGAGQPTMTTTAGVPVSPVLASFSDTSSGLTPAEFRATIDWGDGTRSVGTIATASGGGFVVTGSHAYAQAGSYTARVTVNDFSGAQLATDASVQVSPRSTVTNLVCSPPSVAVSAEATCTATVADSGAGASAPTGLVSFSSTTPGAAFGQDGGCLLGPTAVVGVSACAVQFTPGLLPPIQAHIAAMYGGDGAHIAGNAAAVVAVHPQRCALRGLTRRLQARGLGVLVTCDARSGVQIAVKAAVARKGRLKAFKLQFGTLRASVTSGRPTVLLVKPAPGVLRALRAAVRRHQRVSLTLTLTASSHATTRTTTTRVSALRLP